MSLFSSVVEEVQGQMFLKVEARIRLCLKPAPRWCNKRLWEWLATRFIEVQWLNR